MGGSGGAQAAAAGDDGEESWDEDDDASSYRDDDSSSDGDDDDAGDHIRVNASRVAAATTPCPGPSQPISSNSPITCSALTATASNIPSTSGKHNKELEWDHSSM